MTRIDFYILRSGAPEAAPRLACRLAEKAWQLGHRVYIHTADTRQTEQIDGLLWTFRAESFVPHQRCETATDAAAVLIGHGEPPEMPPDVLINLGPEVPLFFSRFERVAEVVDPDEQHKALARERFRFYRERGYTLKTHELEG